MTQEQSKKSITRKAYIQAYQDTFGTPSGQIVLADLMKKGRVLSPFPMKERNKGDLDFCEGQRQFALAILNLVQYDLNKLIEHNKDFSTEIKYD